VLAQIRDAGVRVVQQPHAGADHFIEVVRGHIGGHAHGDAGGAVEQQMRDARRQPAGFLEGAIEIGIPVHGAVSQLGEQQFGERGELGFGVAHRGERLGVVGRAEVALAVDQRIAVGKRLCHQHQCFVTGTVAVRVELANHVAHGACRLFGLGAGAQAQLAHRIDDPALHRFQAVADERQGAVEDHVHGVVQIRAFGVFEQGNLFETMEAGAGQVGHWAVSGVPSRPL